jgi:hypothetical protein
MEATPRPLEDILAELMTAVSGSTTKKLEAVNTLLKTAQLITLDMSIMEKKEEEKKDEYYISISDSDTIEEEKPKPENKKEEEEEDDPNEVKDLPEGYDRSKVLFWIQTSTGPRLFADRNRKPEKHGAIIGWFCFKKHTAMEARIDVCRNSPYQVDFEHETLLKQSEFNSINQYIFNNYEVEDFSPINL